jgi:hypothetical protein
MIRGLHRAIANLENRGPAAIAPGWCAKMVGVRIAKLGSLRRRQKEVVAKRA